MHKFVLQAKILMIITQKPMFIIKVSNGNVSKVMGNVKNAFFFDCIEIIERNQIKFGVIYAVNGEFEKSILKASRDIPTDVLQQLRNTYNFSR